MVRPVVIIENQNVLFIKKDIAFNVKKKSIYESKQRVLAVVRDVFGGLVCVICGDLVRSRSF